MVVNLFVQNSSRDMLLRYEALQEEFLTFKEKMGEESWKALCGVKFLTVNEKRSDFKAVRCNFVFVCFIVVFFFPLRDFGQS